MSIFKTYKPFLVRLLCLLLLPGFTWVDKSYAHGTKASREIEISKPLPETSNTTSDKDVIKFISKGNQSVHKVGQLACVNCSLAPVSGLESILRGSYRGHKMAPSCKALMNSNGELGSTGHSIFSIMSERKYSRYYTEDNSLGHFCPKFNRLTDSQRLQAWTWFWSALAQEESSCIEKKKHATVYQGRDGRTHVLNPREGYGLWALEKDRNIRRSRGSACMNISTAAGQARCAIDIMTKRQLSRGRTAGNDKFSYWGPVRRGYNQIIPHMRRLKLCF
jgi:hypothetical protein